MPDRAAESTLRKIAFAPEYLALVLILHLLFRKHLSYLIFFPLIFSMRLSDLLTFGSQKYFLICYHCKSVTITVSANGVKIVHKFILTYVVLLYLMRLFCLCMYTFFHLTAHKYINFSSVTAVGSLPQIIMSFNYVY